MIESSQLIQKLDEVISHQVRQASLSYAVLGGLVFVTLFVFWLAMLMSTRIDAQAGRINQLEEYRRQQTTLNLEFVEALRSQVKEAK